MWSRTAGSLKVKAYTYLQAAALSSLCFQHASEGILERDTLRSDYWGLPQLQLMLMVVWRRLGSRTFS
jgi:hypothetical protein